MEKEFVWEADYGERSRLVPFLTRLLDEQKEDTLKMMAFFVNNVPYNFEFYGSCVV